MYIIDNLFLFSNFIFQKIFLSINNNYKKTTFLFTKSFNYHQNYAHLL